MKFRKLGSAVATVALLAMGAIVVPAVSASADSGASGSSARAGVPIKLASKEGDQCHPGGIGIPGHDPDLKDKGVSVYVGGNFKRVSGAELEGQLVVNGNADFGSGLYNVGIVGVGSGVVPVPGADIIRVGGDITAPFLGFEPHVTPANYDASGKVVTGPVKVGGKVIGTVLTGADVTQEMGRQAALGSPSFADWPTQNFKVLQDFANNNLNDATAGTADHDGWTLHLDGKPGAKRHVFNLDASDFGSSRFSLNYRNNILSTPGKTDPVILRVTGSGSVVINMESVLKSGNIVDISSDQFARLASQTLWIFDGPSDITFTGGAQVPGSVVVTNPSSTLTVSVPGMNGRVWVAGNLTHDYSGGEFHSYPFLGDCGIPPSPEPTSPVDPTIIEAQCTAAGDPTTPQVIKPTDGKTIKYQLEGEIKQGGTVKVTATAQKGYTFDQTLPGQWNRVSDSVATWEHTFDVIDCTIVLETQPKVRQATCDADGNFDGPTLQVPTTDGVTYRYDAADVAVGRTVTVTATINDGVNKRFPATMPGWTVADNGKSATWTHTFDEFTCEAQGLVAPSFTEAQCTEAGDPTTPRVGELINSAHIHYRVEGNIEQGGTVTVTATAQKGYVLPVTLPGQWKRVSDTVATWSHTFDVIDCEIVLDVEPQVRQATCDVDGNIDGPTLDVPATDGVTYNYNEEDVVAGGTVTVTATINDGVNKRFPATMPGWQVSADGKTATWSHTFDVIDCEVLPVDPEVKQATCDEATNDLIDPSVELPEATDQIRYTKVGSEVAGGTVIVTAHIVDGQRVRFPADVAGWQVSTDGKTATKKIKLAEFACEAQGLVAPSFTEAQCTEAGDPTTPRVGELINSAHIHYRVEGNIEQGGTVTVTATAQKGYTLAQTLPGQWKRVSDTVATWSHTFDVIDCEVLPVDPEVKQATCDEATNDLIDPSVELPEATDQIRYTKSGSEVAGGTVIVTAHIVDGQRVRFPADVAGWQVSTDGKTATKKIKLAEFACEAQGLVAPSFTEAQCTEAGDPTTPRVGELINSAHIHYRVEGNIEQGGTVTVTATAQKGYTLAQTLPGQWKRVSDTVATWSHTFDVIDCEIVLDVEPQVRQATCDVDGNIDGPTLDVPATDGVTYNYNEEDVVAGGTVTVTATINDGVNKRFPATMPGWTVADNGKSATWTHTYADNPDCTATPVLPDVQQAQCDLDGTVLDPEVTFIDTANVTYEITDGEVAPGSSITVTAYAADYYRFPADIDGWDVNGRTATTVITFTTPNCVAELVEPQAAQATCDVDNQVVEPQLILPEATDQVSYEVTDGEVEAGNVVTVTATAGEGLRFVQSDNGWDVHPDGRTATWTVAFDLVICVGGESSTIPPSPTTTPPAPPTTEQPTTTTPPTTTESIEVLPETSTVPPVAYTGINTAGIGWIALTLLGAGGLLLAFGAIRRRSPGKH